MVMAALPTRWGGDVVRDSVRIGNREMKATYERWQRWKRMGRIRWNKLLACAVHSNETLCDAEDGVGVQVSMIADGRSSR